MKKKALFVETQRSYRDILWKKTKKRKKTIQLYEDNTEENNFQVGIIFNPFDFHCFCSSL